MKKHVDLLWTGGWDSTFRLCQLSRIPGIEVQPFYVQHPQRTSIAFEFKAMEKIYNILSKRKETVADLLPVKIIKFEDIVISDEISSAFKRLRQRFPNLGGQYEFLAAFAQLHPGIELGEEHYYEKPGTLSQILIAGGLSVDTDGIGNLLQDCKDSDIKLIFGNYTYPIVSLKEIEMRDWVQKWRYKDVMRHIWFCQHPVDGKPCGVCTPCCIKMHSGMEFLLPVIAQKNYRILKYLENKKALPERFKLFIWDEFRKEKVIFRALEKKGQNTISLQKNQANLLKEIDYYNNLIMKFR